MRKVQVLVLVAALLIIGVGVTQAAEAPASSAKLSTRRMRRAGTSRGQYHKPLRLFRSQAQAPYARRGPGWLKWAEPSQA